MIFVRYVILLASFFSGFILANEKSFVIDKKDAYVFFKEQGLLESSNTFLPGIGLVGSSFSLLKGFTPDSVVGSVIQYEFEDSLLSHDKKYLYPQGLALGSFPSCSKVSSSFSTDLFKDYQEKITRSLKVEGSYKLFTGLYSPQMEETKRQLAQKNSVVSYMSSACSSYSLKIIPRKIKLASWFVDEVSSLPKIFSEQNKDKFFSFFDYFGDSVIVGCRVGGRLEQTSYTQKDYSKDHGIHKVSSQAKANFFWTLDKNDSLEADVSFEYKSNTQASEIKSYGGSWQAESSSWDSWIKSVQSLDNVACASWDAVQITDLLKYNSELSSHTDALDKALAAYYDRKGCTDPKAKNYDPYALQDDGSCEHRYVENCQHIVVSKVRPQSSLKRIGHFARDSVWLVNGPNSYDMCLVSYAYTSVGGKGSSSSFAGTTGKVVTSPQILSVHRSDDIGYRYGQECRVWASDTKGGILSAFGEHHRWSASSERKHNIGEEVGVKVQLENYGSGSGFAGITTLMQPYKGDS